MYKVYKMKEKNVLNAFGAFSFLPKCKTAQLKYLTKILKLHKALESF